MGTFSKCITATGSGGTAGTYSSVGTVTLGPTAKEIIAIMAVAACDKLTTVEGNGHVLRITGLSSIGTEYFSFGNSYGNGVATNEENFGVSAEFIPTKIPVSGGEIVTVEYSFAGATSTENQDIAVGIMWHDGKGLGPYAPGIQYGAKCPARGGVFEDVDNATVSEVVFSAAGQTIPAWASAITNIMCYPVQDGVPVVDDPIIAKYRFECTSSNFTPQEFPGCVGWSGGLGTSIVGSQGLPTFPYPVYIPLDRGVTHTIKCYSVITVANAANVAHCYNVRYI